MSNRVIFPLLGEGGSGSTAWGQITGTLSNQTDLQEALNAKASSSDIPTATSDLQNDSGFITLSDVPAQVQSDWNQSDNTAVDYIKNKPTIPAAQVNADWNAVSGVAEILNKPTIPAAQVQSDWNQSDNTAVDYIKNKPTIPAAQVNSDWNAVSGVAQILNKPTIPAAQIQSDWNQSNNASLDYIKNKPSMSTETLTFVDANNVSTTVVVYTQPQI